MDEESELIKAEKAQAQRVIKWLHVHHGVEAWYTDGTINVNATDTQYTVKELRALFDEALEITK